MKLNKRIIITISILGASTLILAGAVTTPTVLAIRDIKMKMRATNDDIDQKYALRKHTRTSLAKMQEAKNLIKTLSSVAVVEGEELAFVSALEKAADDVNIKQNLVLETVNQRDLTPWEKEIPLKIDAEGDYRDLIIYLHKVEKLPYYLTIQSIDLKVPQHREDAAAGRVSAHIEASVRWLSKDQPVFKQIEYNGEDLPAESAE